MHLFVLGHLPILGDFPLTGIIFLKWFTRFYTITTPVSFKVLSFWLDTFVPTFYLLLKTFLELVSAEVVQDNQRFLFHFADISKTFPFHLAFHTGEQTKIAWRNDGRIGRTRDNRHVFLPKLLHTQGRVGRGMSWWRNQSPLLHISGLFFSVHYRVIFSAPHSSICCDFVVLACISSLFLCLLTFINFCWLCAPV